LTQSIDLEGAQNQFSRTLSSRVTGPPVTTLVLELSRQRVGAWPLEHQRLMRRRSMAPQRLEPHYGDEQINFRFHFRWKSLGERPS
jgi:hypothetical protein